MPAQPKLVKLPVPMDFDEAMRRAMKVQPDKSKKSAGKKPKKTVPKS
jgi:hypothetical protein